MSGMDSLRRIKAEMLLDSLRAKPEPPCAPCTAAAEGDIPIHGYMALYDTWTSDGGEIRRRILGGALRWDLEEEGIPIVVEHDGGVRSVVGRIDEAFNDEVGLYGSGRLFAPSPEDQDSFDRLVNQISENALGWSVMMSEETGNVRYIPQEITENKDGTAEIPISVMQELTIDDARVRHLAIVDVPAFPGARPALGTMPLAIAASAGVAFPAEHFAKWESRDYVPLQVSPDGRIWGHGAGDSCYRTGSKSGVCSKYSPDPDPEMRNFHTGTATLDNGEVIRVGALTCASLHADISLTHSEQRHYHENSSTVWARVRAWNDSRGRLCISGSVVPGLDDRLLNQVAGLPISVELWPVPGVSGLTLVGAHTVVTPAWPVAASAG